MMKKVVRDKKKRKYTIPDWIREDIVNQILRYFLFTGCIWEINII